MMKKFILFSLTSIICSIMAANTNAMSKNWMAIRQNINARQMYGGRQGVTAVLSQNASWKEFHKAQRREIQANLRAQNIIVKNIEEKEISNLLEPIVKEQITAILQQEEIAPHHYNHPEDQKEYETFINDLRKLLQE
jgi:hypothetical protein